MTTNAPGPSHASTSIAPTGAAALVRHFSRQQSNAQPRKGASTVEGYPVKAPSVDPYTGYDAMFARAGFRLVRPGRGRGRALWRKDVIRAS